MPIAQSESWIAGYEMGRLDAQLAARRVREVVGLTVRAVNREAVGELGDRHGYTVSFGVAAEPGFLWARFEPQA